MKMDFLVVQPSDGLRGGILMMWRSDVQVHKIFAEPNYIDVRIVEDVNKERRFTGMYGEFKCDLNEILYDQEKEGALLGKCL
jgi:hypothetical protein